MELHELIEYYKERCDILAKAISQLQDINIFVNRKSIADEIFNLRKEFDITNNTVIMLHRQKEVNG